MPNINAILFKFYRWRALKRGLVLQITYSLPLRRTILQSGWRVFADLSEFKICIDYPYLRVRLAIPLNFSLNLLALPSVFVSRRLPV